MSLSPIEKKLIETGYQNLFLFGERSLADSIWENGKNRNELQRIIENPSGSLHARFLVAELFRHYGVPFEAKDKKQVAEAYAYALANSSAEKPGFIGTFGNLWGFLYEMNDSGELGAQLINLGEPSVSYLASLLNSNSPVVYEGSKDAMVGNEYQYRIKDFAAFYLSKITGIPVQFHKDLKERDREIERLKEELKKK